jgi:hypothetical protein
VRFLPGWLVGHVATAGRPIDGVPRRSKRFLSASVRASERSIAVRLDQRTCSIFEDPGERTATRSREETLCHTPSGARRSRGSTLVAVASLARLGANYKEVIFVCVIIIM